MLDLSNKPAANLRQHIGVSSLINNAPPQQCSLPSVPVSNQTSSTFCNPPQMDRQPCVITPRFHMAPYVPTTAPSTPARSAYGDYQYTVTNNSVDERKISAGGSKSPTSSRNKSSDGVISSSSRNSQEWQKYVTPSRYSPLSGYCTGSGNGSGNSAGNSPYSSARSSPCRDMITDTRPVVNWTHLEQVKLLQEVI